MLSREYAELAMTARKQGDYEVEEKNWWRAYMLDTQSLRLAVGWANACRINARLGGLEEFVQALRKRFRKKAATDMTRPQRKHYSQEKITLARFASGFAQSRFAFLLITCAR